MKMRVLVAVSFLLLFSCTPQQPQTAPVNAVCENCNVILIAIDTLRADHLGSYGYFRNTSPNIDRIAQNSILFENAYSPSSWTRPAFASMFTSKHPTELGIYSEAVGEILQDEFFTLQEFFNERNYSTGAIYTNPHFNFGLVQNFSYSYYEPSDGISGSADSMYDMSLKWIKKNSNNKFFLLIHSIDPHETYIFHRGFSYSPKINDYRELQTYFPPLNDSSGATCDDREGIVQLDEEELSVMKANYDGEIAFVDDQIGRLMSYLKKSGLDRNTIIIITSDHGEEFLDHGGYWHGCTLYEELIRAPLIIYHPAFDANKFAQKVSTLDIFPTLVEILNGGQSYELTGQSLLPLMENKEWAEKPIFSATAFRGELKYSIIDGDYKLIKSAKGNIIGLYNLSNDPRELDNLTNQNLIQQMDDLLSQIVNATKKTFISKPKEIDEQTLEELKSLGYLA